MSKNHYEMSAVASANLEIDYLRGQLNEANAKLKDEKVARELLRKKGYFVDNLWCVDDVTQNWSCSKEVAMDVLKKALMNEATMEQVFFAIDDVAESMELKQVDIGMEDWRETQF